LTKGRVPAILHIDRLAVPTACRPYRRRGFSPDYPRPAYSRPGRCAGPFSFLQRISPPQTESASQGGPSPASAYKLSSDPYRAD